MPQQLKMFTFQNIVSLSFQIIYPWLLFEVLFIQEGLQYMQALC